MKITQGGSLSVLAVASLAAAAFADAAAAQAERLRGTVVDVRTGAPVADAVVGAENRTAGVDAEGRFELCRLASGEVRLNVVATGFDRVDSVVSTDFAGAGEVRIALRPNPPGGPLTVTHDYGRGIPAHRAVFVVDGVRIFYSASGCEDPPPGVPVLDALDPDDIETVEIMKGPAAVERYGPDAVYGAVIITTNRGRPDDLSPR